MGPRPDVAVQDLGFHFQPHWEKSRKRTAAKLKKPAVHICVSFISKMRAAKAQIYPEITFIELKCLVLNFANVEGTGAVS